MVMASDGSCSLLTDVKMLTAPMLYSVFTVPKLLLTLPEAALAALFGHATDRSIHKRRS